MKTEQMVRQERHDDPHAVSRALQDLAPSMCKVVDARGKPVALSSAGYVLRPGTAYRVQLIPSCKDSELKEIRIISLPEFISADPELKEVADDGRSTTSLPFSVKGDFWTHARRLGLDVRCAELEVAQYCHRASEKRIPSYRIPVVVRARWPILVAAILIGLVGTVLEKLATEVLWSGHAPAGGVRGVVQRTFTDEGSWLWMGGLSLGAIALVCGINAYHLHRRSRELRQQFREAYPPSLPPAD